MFKLTPRHYQRIVPLIEKSGMHGHLALVYEVLEGRTTGQVFVDSAAHIRTALICPRSGFFFAFGEPDIDVLRPVLEDFWQRPDEMAANYTSLFGAHSGWNRPLHQFFHPLGANPSARLAFEQRSEPPDLPVPPGFRLEPIDVHWASAILDGTGTGGFGLDPWFIRIANGPEVYVRYGLGQVLVTGDQIASMCGFCGLGNGEAELEVGTVPAYRGRGLAQIVSAAFMRQCKARGIQPAYTCGTNNLPSIGVAHKLGFVEIEEIRGYELFKRVDHPEGV